MQQAVGNPYLIIKFVSKMFDCISKHKWKISCPSLFTECVECISGCILKVCCIIQNSSDDYSFQIWVADNMIAYFVSVNDSVKQVSRSVPYSYHW